MQMSGWRDGLGDGLGEDAGERRGLGDGEAVAVTTTTVPGSPFGPRSPRSGTTTTTRGATAGFDDAGETTFGEALGEAPAPADGDGEDVAVAFGSSPDEPSLAIAPAAVRTSSAKMTMYKTQSPREGPGLLGPVDRRHLMALP